MFIEPLISQIPNRGWIEMIAGPMFSGKTEELIRRLKRAKIANRKVAIFKPSIDKRYSKDNVVSHDASSIPSIVVDRAIQIIEHYDDADVIGIDEVQFFNTAIVDIVQYLALKGKRVIIAGLDMDSSGKPFGPVPALMAVSEYVTKLHAICIHCGSLATHSFRTSNEEGLILIGEKDKYLPLCRHCYHVRSIESGEEKIELNFVEDN
jgi:thymidine kinase